MSLVPALMRRRDRGPRQSISRKGFHAHRMGLLPRQIRAFSA
jgi:hypothetical protein